MANIYTYVDFTGFLSEVAETDLNFAGTWRSTANYYRYDVVTYGSARYVCTTANTDNAPPTNLQFNTYWSIIAFTSTGTGSSGTGSSGVDYTPMIQDVYSLAYRAYSIALTGTDLPSPGAIDPWVMDWVGQTYNIAVAGTDAADQAWGYAGQAFDIAVAGTDAANQAYSLALQALQAAWVGTDTPVPSGGSGSIPGWVMDWIGHTANVAYTGTNAADQAYSLALQALQTAWVGTDTPVPSGGSGSIPGWVMDWIGQTSNIAVSGTDAANQAWDYAGQAFDIAVAGTNAADQAYSLALQALQTAWVGTDTPTPSGGSGTQTFKSVVHCLAFTPTSTGPDAGEVVIPHGHDGVSVLSWDVKRLVFRVQTTGTGSSVLIEKSTGTGGFSATTVGTVAVATGAYEGYSFPTATVLSGDKMRFNVTDLGSTQNWFLSTDISV